MPTQVNIGALAAKDIRNLKRKYPAVSAEVRKLIFRLEADERPGDKVPGVGYDTYKVRLPNSSAQRGKSGGFRVIYYVRLADYIVLVTVYSKTEQSDISPDAIRRAIEDILPPD